MWICIDNNIDYVYLIELIHIFWKILSTFKSSINVCIIIITNIYTTGSGVPRSDHFQSPVYFKCILKLINLVLNHSILISDCNIIDRLRVFKEPKRISNDWHLLTVYRP